MSSKSKKVLSVDELLKIHKRVKEILSRLQELGKFDRENYPKKREIAGRKDGFLLIDRDGDSLLLDYFDDQNRMSHIYLRVKDSSTGEYHFLSVPKYMQKKTCKDAIAWTFDKLASEYNPIKET